MARSRLITVALSKDVEAFVEEQIRSGVRTDAATLVNDVLRSPSEHRSLPHFDDDELEEWLLEAADSPSAPLTAADFEGIRARCEGRNMDAGDCQSGCLSSRAHRIPAK